MKGLVRNYINLLSIDKLESFALKNDIKLKNDQLEYILNLVKENFEDILINDEKYFDLLKSKIDKNNLEKIKSLFLYYKSKYSGYLF